MLHTIDDDDNDRKAQDDYDESDDEEGVLRGPGEELTTPIIPLEPSSELPLDNEADIDLSSAELKQILADVPPTKKTKVSAFLPPIKDSKDGGEIFELGA